MGKIIAFNARSATFIIGPSPASVVTIGPAAATAQLVGPEPSVPVVPPRRGTWQERGWRQRPGDARQVFEGFYQVHDKKSGQERFFEGRIRLSGHQTEVFVADPPPQIKRHPKGTCFSAHHPPWFRLHWHRSARNVDEAILYVERVLDESLNGRN